MNPTFEATLAFGDAVPPPTAARWPLPARLMARLLRRHPLELQCDPAHLDRWTGVFNRAGVFVAASASLREGAREGAAAIIVLDFSDLREVHDIYGSATSRRIVASIVRKLRSVAGPDGFVGRTDRAQFTVFLQDTTEDAARRRLQRAMGKPARIEFDAGDSEIVLVPDVGLTLVDPGAAGIQPAHAELCEQIARRQRDEMRRQHWLTRERERHSRPMALSSR